jgi:hypothetical protein
MISLPNALIIVGTDRNAGKTTLASRIIERYSQELKIIAVKISPHFHPIEPNEHVIARMDQYVIVKEELAEGGKDSSRFLRAGASEVYYLQVWDQDLHSAFSELTKICGTDKSMVIESGWIRNIIVPGLFIIVNKKGNLIFKQGIAQYRQFPHLWIEAGDDEFTPGVNSILWKEGRWSSE